MEQVDACAVDLHQVLMYVNVAGAAYAMMEPKVFEPGHTKMIQLREQDVRALRAALDHEYRSFAAHDQLIRDPGAAPAHSDGPLDRD